MFSGMPSRSVLTEAELLLPPQLPDKHQECHLSEILVYRKTGIDYG